MKDNNVENKAQSEPSAPTLNILNIYIKDSSFESPNTPSIFASEWQPQVDFDLQMGSQAIEENTHEVVLSITVTVKLPEEKTAFLIEVKQAGIFQLNNFTDEQLKRVLATACPGILFPYAREHIANMIMRGGFPQFILPPVNFEALYMQHLQNDVNKQAQTETIN
ncbi:MAG: protein-export chaperone SecB [Francisellaceae bacterium]|nr:protein-export chaperone SecB [Francisellaceae bacterium]